ncbi:hypothetical protein CsSME_00047881 [Camellia sinensis var. sinensis]
MGAPKQKWTPEEEAALRAGVVKHGAGKWRTILKDPEFSGVLYLRSNVDLKVYLKPLFVCFYFLHGLFFSKQMICMVSGDDSRLVFFFALYLVVSTVVYIVYQFGLM